MAYPAPSPHGPPEAIGDDLFVVYGSFRANALVRFTRNMAVVREGDALTLINAVRLDDAGLRALDKLGEVRHVLRLGPFHGLDDPFYVDRYGAAFWAFTDGSSYTAPPIDHELGEGAALPFGRATLFVFGHLRQTEGAILLERDPAILLTCDAVQSYAAAPHKPYSTLLARLVMPLLGFPNRTLVGPIWVKRLAEDREAVQGEFERLLTFEFDQLLSAHGVFLPGGAHQAVARAVAERFA